LTILQIWLRLSGKPFRQEDLFWPNSDAVVSAFAAAKNAAFALVVDCPVRFHHGKDNISERLNRRRHDGCFQERLRIPSG